MQKFIKDLLNSLFPQKCIKCGALGVVLCENCLNHIPFAEAPERKNIYAIYDYGNRTVEKAIRDLKYYRKGEPSLILARKSAPHIVEFISSSVQSESPESIILVPIPIHKQKSGRRGFNQSEMLARAIADELDGARVLPILKKHRFTLPQARIQNKNERLTNLKYSMTSTGQLEKESIYVLIDDVTTTGATFIEAERALRSAGAKKILCIALAHGYSRK